MEPRMVRSGHDSQAPLPSGQTVGETNRDQHRNVPTPPEASPAMRNVQVPFASDPKSPTKEKSDPSGRNLPTNGAAAPVINGKALVLSNVVRWVSTQLMP